MKALIIQHDHISPPGPVAEALSDAGYDLDVQQVVPTERFHSPDVEYQLPPMTDFDVVVPMGAPWSAYDHRTIGSWLGPELDALRAADAAGVPILGICFGGQLLAAAHGGTVARSAQPELGWTKVTSDDEGIVPGGDWFQWHYDRWTLPPGASEIARNAAASQAFVLRRNLAVQFHPELTGAMLEGWLDEGGLAELAEFGIEPEPLIAITYARDDKSRRRAHRLVQQFLRRVASAA